MLNTVLFMLAVEKKRENQKPEKDTKKKENLKLEKGPRKKENLKLEKGPRKKESQNTVVKCFLYTLKKNN